MSLVKMQDNLEKQNLISFPWKPAGEDHCSKHARELQPNLSGTARSISDLDFLSGRFAQSMAVSVNCARLADHKARDETEQRVVDLPIFGGPDGRRSAIGLTG